MPGFSVDALVTGMQGARVLRVAPNGDIFLALSRPEGKIVTIRTGTGMSNPKVETFATGLQDAYGIAFYPPGPDPKWIYVGELGKVVRFPYRNGDLTASGAPETIVSDLATGGNHWTRDVAFSPDGKTMYVAVGSASNVAEQMGPRPADFAAFEKTHSPGSAWDREEWRANVLTYDPDGKNKQVFASGVRNCSGLTLQPGTGVVYCATNERDLLGDNLPPDYVAGVKPGAFYGWPWYYIGNHEDTRPGGGRRPDLADKVTAPDVLIQPHSAPLGIAFDPGGQFPPDWKGDAFVALHGSWNRALRTGYKIIRLPFKDGKPTGEYQDFVVGFVADDQNVWGRPVDVTFAKDGSLLFSDDGNDIVYRVTYKPE
jgi:glucose/arabinose dehydrogenase